MRRRSLPGSLPLDPVEIDTGTLELLPDPDRPSAFMVYVNGVESSFVDLEDPGHLEFEYMQQMRLAIRERLREKPASRILHLGGAACAFARALATEEPRSRQVVVELDGELARLAREWFDVPRSPLVRIRVDEARAAVSAMREDAVDIIIRDAFAGARVPRSLTTSGFLGEVRRVLQPGGLYLGNLVDSPPLPVARREVATALATFRHVMLAVEPPILKGRRFGNLVVLASDAPIDSQRLQRDLLALPAPVRLLEGRACREFAGTALPLQDEPDPLALPEEFVAESPSDHRTGTR
ncbi:spermidine synthase [Serinibacter salmoneus]|uniref:Spermidine synthase n=1 Tax=Serinibacter salmoneus TaxID=556530 RepID=A0A2A9CZF3_9MICO|nr:fused MFS/spermidine synthase [Serinibacter salmoneus]PFG19375.1 hypothetical protein ATL40_0935 [Serinibacter salmoneus]